MLRLLFPISDAVLVPVSVYCTVLCVCFYLFLELCLNDHQWSLSSQLQTYQVIIGSIQWILIRQWHLLSTCRISIAQPPISWDITLWSRIFQNGDSCKPAVGEEALVRTQPWRDAPYKGADWELEKKKSLQRGHVDPSPSSGVDPGCLEGQDWEEGGEKEVQGSEGNRAHLERLVHEREDQSGA